jgi:hypothetical protein
MVFLVINTFFFSIYLHFSADPKFSSPIPNVTFAVGREAILTCVVHDLGSYKVSFPIQTGHATFLQNP